MPLITMKQIMADSLKKALDPSVDTKERYAVGAFNFSTIPEMVGIVEGAREVKSPVILMLSLGALKYICSLELVAYTARGIARQYPEVPFCLHLDHATDLEMIKQAVVAGFTNVMIDASQEPYEDNVRKSKEIADFAHKHSPLGLNGCSVEAELGMLAGHEDNIHVSEEDAGKAYTDPELVADFVEKTGIDALAVAIGTAHGFYKAAPKIRFDLLEEIRRKTDTALVLHGGTGVPEDDFRKCVAMGMSKINVGTGLKKVYTDAVREAIKSLPESEYDPRKIVGPGRKAIAAEIASKSELFNCAGKAEAVLKSMY
ncbi:MAG: class II fructose-bisphosphate aldolase [Lachnospiraceae bacterium]|nr:class II fructose-bisphosphate aldolase [Lachnospiraceae bacterium]